MRSYIIRPHDLAWQYSQCKRCYFLRLRGLTAPDEKLPGIFRHIDSGMKRGVTLEHVRQLGIPAVELIGTVKHRSTPFEYPELGVSLILSGATDNGVMMEDGTAGVIEFKTAEPSPGNLHRYRTQLWAYQAIFERPATGRDPIEVSTLALVFFNAYQGAFKASEKLMGYQCGMLEHRPVSIDRPAFESVLLEVATLLAPVADLPEPGNTCEICAHVRAIRKFEDDLAKIAQRSVAK